MANKETSVNIFERMIAADSAKVGEVIVCAWDIFMNALAELEPQTDGNSFEYKGLKIINGSLFGQSAPKDNTAFMVTEEGFHGAFTMYGLTLMLN